MSIENKNNHPINFCFSLESNSWHAMCAINDENEFVDLALLASSDRSNEEIVALVQIIESLKGWQLNDIIDSLSGHMSDNNIVHSSFAIDRSKLVQNKGAKIACIENLVIMCEQAFRTAKEEQARSKKKETSTSITKARHERGDSMWKNRIRHLLNCSLNDPEIMDEESSKASYSRNGIIKYFELSHNTLRQLLLNNMQDELKTFNGACKIVYGTDYNVSSDSQMAIAALKHGFILSSSIEKPKRIVHVNKSNTEFAARTMKIKAASLEQLQASNKLPIDEATAKEIIRRRDMCLSAEHPFFALSRRDDEYNICFDTFENGIVTDSIVVVERDENGAATKTDSLCLRLQDLSDSRNGILEHNRFLEICQEYILDNNLKVTTLQDLESSFENEEAFKKAIHSYIKDMACFVQQMAIIKQDSIGYFKRV